MARSTSGASAPACKCVARRPTPGSEAFTDILRIRVHERRLRTLDVFEAGTLWRERVRPMRCGRVADRAAERRGSVRKAQKGHHVVLVDAVAGDADSTDERVAAVDRNTAREDLQAIAESQVGAVAHRILWQTARGISRH